jgi:hypothetical protein
MPATDHELEEARRHLVLWLRYYMRGHADCATQDALAKKLGITQGNVSVWFKAGSKRLPGFAALLSIKKLVNVPLDILLGVDPPQS